jgi:predicted Zn-dependent peptidase
MRIYYIFIIFCLLFLYTSCKTAIFPSIFQGGYEARVVIPIESAESNFYSQELVLRNGLRVIIKESERNNVKFGIYLRSTPLYQDPLNSGIEKITLSYLRTQLLNKTFMKLKVNNLFAVDIGSNNDFSYMTFSVNRAYARKVLDIFIDSMKITRFNYYQLKSIIEQNKLEMSKKMNDPKYYVDYKLSGLVFKMSPLYNTFDGSPFSLSLIKPDDIIKYYKNNFTPDRIVMMISGNVKKELFRDTDFVKLDSTFSRNNEIEREYERLISKRFDNPPYYIPKDDIKGVCYVEALHKAPAFVDDDFFAFYLAMLIMDDNLRTNTPVSSNTGFYSGMINKVNYGRISFVAKSTEVEFILLTLKKTISKLEDGVGSFYYRSGPGKEDAVTDYRAFDEKNLVAKKISAVLAQYKKSALDRFDLSNLNRPEKENTYISLYFLLKGRIDRAVISDRIDKITEDDVIKACKKYYSNISWAILTDSATISGLSKEFFY